MTSARALESKQVAALKLTRAFALRPNFQPVVLGEGAYDV